MNDALWNVGLSPWIVQDGNYGDFHVGDVSEFALEFYAERALSAVEGATRSATLVDPEDSTYQISAEVVATPAGVCVIDFGVRAYREEPGPDVRAALGGEIYLGIDPFFYFESLASRAGMPPLIYTWRIERILSVTAPLVRVAGGRIGSEGVEQHVLAPDLARRVVTAVDATDAWSEDRDLEHSLHYVLVCQQIDAPPKHRRALA